MELFTLKIMYGMFCQETMTWKPANIPTMSPSEQLESNMKLNAAMQSRYVPIGGN